MTSLNRFDMTSFEITPGVSPDIAACADRAGGHFWQVVGEPGEEPELSCRDCPATGHSVYPDVIDLLNNETYEIGDHTVHFGRELPGDACAFAIPVDVRIKECGYTSLDWIGYEYEVEIRITPRDALDPEVIHP